MLNLTDHQYGRLVVRRFKERIGRGGRRGTYWYCDCSCGATDVVVSTKQLRTSVRPTRSCGCLMRETARATITALHTHKESKGNGTPEYRAWKSIKVRCYNKKYKQYKDYGGRGITVCKRWLHSYENFLADIGRRPSPQHSLDRRKVNGNYCPSNCYWAADQEQRLNKRTTVMITIGRETLPRITWLRRFGVPEATYCWRVKHGYTPAEAVFGKRP